jgi:hypothetical protein
MHHFQELNYAPPGPDVDQGGGRHLISEDLAPGLKAPVRSDDHGASLVAAGDQRKAQVGSMSLQRHVADLVDFPCDGQLGFKLTLTPLGDRKLRLLVGAQTIDFEKQNVRPRTR